MPPVNKHNDPLETFFKKKAGEFDIRFQESDWHQLESKLDLKDAKLAYRKKVAWIAAAAILIITILSYFTFDNYQRLNELHRQVAADADPPPAEQPFSPGLVGEQLPALSESHPALSVEQESADEAEPIIESETEIAEQTIAASDIDVQQIRTTHTAPPVMAGIENISKAALTSFDKKAQDTRDRLTEAALNRYDTGLSAHESFHQATQPDNYFPAIATTEFSRLSVGIGISPDFSAAGELTGFQRPGYKIGLSAEYRITRNLTFSAGAYRSVVRYSTSNAANYSPSQRPTGTNPNRITGQCLLLDIPVSLVYTFYRMDNSRFLFSAGLASYYMIDEDYQFDYPDGYIGGIQSWSGRTGTFHLFSNTRFSLGYEMGLNRDLSIRAEPYIHIPLQKVGWSEVNLYSLGSLISLHYRL